jgi:hypothetical protein
MPDGKNGGHPAKRLLQENPALRVTYATRFSADIVGKDFSLREGFNFLEACKPAQAVPTRLDSLE